jgi:hypothetical protein
VITAGIVLSYLVGVIALVDQLRRSPSEWTAADRNRSWWLGTTAVLSLFACGLLVGFAYLVGVVPYFADAESMSGDFAKHVSSAGVAPRITPTEAGAAPQLPATPTPSTRIELTLEDFS